MAKVNDFARELSEKYGLSLGDASDFVSAMFDVVKEELDGADSSVKIKGFGTFKVSAVGARASVDVNTGERIIIDGRNKISFTPEVLLRDRVNRPFVQFETVVLNDGVDFSEIDEESEEELDSVTETEPQEVQLSPTAPTSQSTDQSTDQPTFSEQPQGVQLSSTAPTGQSTGQSANPQSPSETASKAVNTEEHRDMARRLMTPKTETVEEDSEESDDKTTATAPEADDEGIVIGGCRQRSPRIMYVLTIASFIILVSLGIGMYFLYQRIEEKNHVIDRLESRLYAQQEAAETVEPQSTVTVKDTVASKDSLHAAELLAAEKAKQHKKDSIAANPTATTPSDYNYDTRVRTGAYIIVGVAKTVTVQPGQTLASISKAYLGEGMECYVEVLNNRHSVEAGEKLKIPQLKLKPRKR
ncbi:MAG: HU family DNA-binding protein [Prevotella sp.]|nr:HU family DNA-binding protein [Prevotella sp.]